MDDKTLIENLKEEVSSLKMTVKQLIEDMVNMKSNISTVEKKQNDTEKEMISVKSDIKNTFEVVKELKTDMRDVKIEVASVKDFVTNKLNEFMLNVDRKQLETYESYKKYAICSVIGIVVTFFAFKFGLK